MQQTRPRLNERILISGVLLCLLFAGASVAHTGHERQDQPPQVLAPGYTKLEFEAPAPGTYRLPPLGEAGDGTVLDTGGRSVSLRSLMDGRITVLSFIYTSCSDVNGCPLATFVLSRLQDHLLAEPGLNDQVRLISLSFDPAHDTPKVMADYGSKFHNPACEWRFVTTASERALEPIMAAYGQSVVKDYDADGNYLGTMSHILRVYLIDRHRRIRNIYSVSFLHADSIINDIKTILGDGAAAVPAAAAAAGPSLHGAGDVKAGYESAEYTTRSKELTARRGQPADLVALARRASLGLPPVPAPADNPLTTEKVALGRKLFFDRRLSLNNTISCAMCHIPEQGFTSNELATAVGIEGRTVRRNAPTLYNVAYAKRLFHDAREERLEQQIWGPLLAVNEMGNPAVGTLLLRIRSLPDYAGLFETAFKGRTASMETLGMAIASYERTLISGDSPFDRWFYGEEAGALSADAERGYALFTGKANCVACHSIGRETALFTDQQLHNTGIGYARSMGLDRPTRTVLLAPGTPIEIDPKVLADASETPPADLGYYEITQDPADRWKYRTPSLRNVALTAPYMHDGSLATLRDVVRFYNRGGVANEGRDPLVRPLNLDAAEIDALVAFLESLTGANVDTLIADAFAAPVGDPSGD